MKTIQSYLASGVGKKLRVRNTFGSVFGKSLIDSIKTSAIEEWLVRRAPGRRNRRNMLLIIRTFFNFARSKGYLPKNQPTAADEIPLPRVPVAAEIPIFSSDDMARMLHGTPERKPKDESVLWLGLGGFAGLRTAEILRLDWIDIQMATGYIVVRARNAKTGRRRIIPIQPNLAKWLRPLAKPAGPLFDRNRPEERTHDYAKSIGVKWQPNGLRHSFISYRVAQTQDLATRDAPDTRAPVIAVRKPASSATVVGNAGGLIPVDGWASDNSDVNQVLVSLNGAPFTGATLTPLLASPGRVNWSASVKPENGMNRLVANPVMSSALAAGLEVTALHNHFFYDEPKVYFMHIGGEGEAAKLATAVKTALDAQKGVRAGSPEPAKTFDKPLAVASSITAGPLEAALGGKAQAKDGMAKFVIGRSARMPCGCTVGKEIGVNTWAAFAGADGDALVDGDFCVLPGELQGVLKSLRKSGVNIVAIHHHMAMEEPRYIFLHYWGRGPAVTLADALKAALTTLDAK